MPVPKISCYLRHLSALFRDMAPKHMQPTIPPDILAELLALRPDIERILADRPRGFCPGIEDKLQLVMLKVIKHFPSYQPHKDGLKPWVSRISHNVKLDAYRGKQRRDETFGHDRVDPDFTPSRAMSPERNAQVQSFLIRVCDAIIEMPEQHQEVLILVAIGEMSHEDAAERLGITKDAAKMRLSRAREYLRRRVGSIDDHIGVIPLITSNTNVPSQTFIRRALTLAGQFGHLWPPLFAGICALSQMESSAQSTNAEMIIVAESARPSAHTIHDEPNRTDMAPPNTSFVVEPTRSFVSNIQHRRQTNIPSAKPRQIQRRVSQFVSDIDTNAADLLVGDGL